MNNFHINIGIHKEIYITVHSKKKKKKTKEFFIACTFLDN